ncbi:exported protein [Alicycliphilus sp. B1]|nr:exported protein [Alicycliphilus sp. B1]
MHLSMLKRAAVLACATVLALPAFAAEDYPRTPITLVVGYGAGGGTDVCNRALALDVGRQLGQPLVVDNKPGAGSSLSVGFITRQRPDGYSIASLSTGGVLNQVLSPNVKYDVTKDLTPIAMVAQYQVGLLVRADSAYKTMADLINAAQSAKKPLTYSTAGIGTPQHLTTERLAQKTGTQWVHAPYKSGPEAITALMRETSTSWPRPRSGCRMCATGACACCRSSPASASRASMRRPSRSWGTTSSPPASWASRGPQEWTRPS